MRASPDHWHQRLVWAKVGVQHTLSVCTASKLRESQKRLIVVAPYWIKSFECSLLYITAIDIYSLWELHILKCVFSLYCINHSLICKFLCCQRSCGLLDLDYASKAKSTSSLDAFTLFMIWKARWPSLWLGPSSSWNVFWRETHQPKPLNRLQHHFRQLGLLCPFPMELCPIRNSFTTTKVIGIKTSITDLLLTSPKIWRIYRRWSEILGPTAFQRRICWFGRWILQRMQPFCSFQEIELQKSWLC